MQIDSNIVTAFFTAVPATLLALGTLVTSLKNARKLDDVHLTLNSRLTELIKTTLAQGRQNERDDQRDGSSTAPTKSQPAVIPIVFVPTVTIDKDDK